MSIARMSAAVAPTPGLLALQKAEQFDRHLGAGCAGWKRPTEPQCSLGIMLVIGDAMQLEESLSSAVGCRRDKLQRGA
jgi:hypothetical protein